MQAEAQQGRMASIHHVYFGKNVSSFNRQSGGWVKNASDVIFSQNIAHDFRDNSGGPGACYGQQYNNDNIWYLFNEGYNCNIGIAISSADSNINQSAYIIGNIIHDTRSSGTNVYDRGAMVIRGSSKVYVVNNTITNTEHGINMPPGTNSVAIYNNILANRLNSSASDLYTEGGVSLDVKNNIFPASPKFTGASAGTNSITGDPKFMSSSDYHLQSSSSAVNTGILSPVYATFQSRYGIDISKDFTNNARPVGSWDIGAYEFR